MENSITAIVLAIVKVVMVSVVISGEKENGDDDDSD